MSELFVLTERPAVYLASKSERRQELLRQLGVEFESLLLREALGRRRDVVEAPRKDEPPIEYVKRVARHALGKPADAAGAVAMLAALSGRTHEVITAVAVRWQTQLVAAVSTSRVTLRAIARDEIERYVATGESFDKAGGYAIQGRAAVFVQHLEGSYSGVMGLPLHETAEILARIGFPVI